jgi:hypothetical protein
MYENNKKHNSTNSTNSRYLSIMMPLCSGQSQQIMVEVWDKTPKSCNLICEHCYNKSSVILPDKRRVRVGECPDCAIENMFSNSYGCIIPENTCIDEFIKNPSKYELTPSHWLTAYVDDTIQLLYLKKHHKYHNFRNAIDILFDNASDNIYDSSNVLQQKQQHQYQHQHQQKQIVSPKLISRFRRKTDLEDQMLWLSLSDNNMSNRNDRFDNKRAKVI